MNESTRRSLRNVIVLALVDGKFSEPEKRLVSTLRARLGVDDQEFRQVCEEVRRDRTRLSRPRDSQEAGSMLRMLVDMAVADEEIGQTERKVLGQFARAVDIGEEALAELIDAAQVDQAEIHERIEELYAHFAGWDASARREHLGGFEKFGHAAVKPLVRVLESYRQPDGAAEAYELKACVAEQLGRLGDSRAVPYLIQHLGTSTDEAGAAAFRAAAVRAIWQLALAGDPREEIAAVQAWWDKSGRRRYDKLTL